jgi:hypothetical protein
MLPSSHQAYMIRALTKIGQKIRGILRSQVRIPANAGELFGGVQFRGSTVPLDFATSLTDSHRMEFSLGVSCCPWDGRTPLRRDAVRPRRVKRPASGAIPADLSTGPQASAVRRTRTYWQAFTLTGSARTVGHTCVHGKQSALVSAKGTGTRTGEREALAINTAPASSKAWLRPRAMFPGRTCCLRGSLPPPPGHRD